MNPTLRGIFCFLLLSVAAVAADEPIKIVQVGGEVPPTVISAPRDEMVILRGQGEGITDGTWEITPIEAMVKKREGDNGLEVAFAAKPGTYSVFFISRVDGKYLKARWVITIVDGLPPTPVPPGPSPNPIPPTPVPVPVPKTGFAAIYVYESSQALPREQLNAWNSTAAITYLNEKASKIDGRAGWRKWDHDVDTSNETETWRATWAAVKGQIPSLPALVIVKEGKTYVSAFPATEAELLAKLKEFGG